MPPFHKLSLVLRSHLYPWDAARIKPSLNSEHYKEEVTNLKNTWNIKRGLNRAMTPNLSDDYVSYRFLLYWGGGVVSISYTHLYSKHE